MATRKPRSAPDGLVSPEEVATLDYEALVAAWCAATDHTDATHVPGVTMPGLPPGAGAMVRRLEELATQDPSIVEVVAAAEAHPSTGTRGPGDLSRAESSMALAAIRRSPFLADDGGIARRGPFARLSTTTTTRRTPTP